MSNTRDLIKQYSAWEKTRPKGVHIVPKPTAATGSAVHTDVDKLPVYTSTETLPTYNASESSSDTKGNQQAPEIIGDSGARKTSDTNSMPPPSLPEQTGQTASVFGMKRVLQPGAGMADMNAASWWRGDGQGRLW
jgi:hypothetical protein